MGEEQLGEFRQVNGVMGRDEEGLFGQAVDYYQDHSVSLQCQKLFNEVHGDGFPWSWGNWQLFEKTIQFVPVCLGTCTYHTGSDVLFDHLGKTQPMTRLVDQVDGHGGCGLAGDRVVQVHRCILCTTSAPPSIPNLVMSVGLSIFS